MKFNFYYQIFLTIYFITIKILKIYLKEIYMFSISFIGSILFLFMAVVINLSIFCSNEKKDEKHLNKYKIFAVIFLIFSIFLLWTNKPDNKTYILSKYASYYNQINVLSNNSSIQNNLKSEFKSICDHDSCSLFEGDSKFYIDNVNLYKNIRSISILPVYSYFNTIANRESEPFFIYQTVSKRSVNEQLILEKSSKQSLFKVEFKDKNNPVYLLVQLSTIDPNGMIITFKKDKFILHARKPEIYRTNYDEFNTIIINAINKAHSVNNDLNSEQNKKIWSDKEIK